MILIEDIENNHSQIQKAIDKFGFAPEHNFGWFRAYTGCNQKPVAVVWPDGEMVLAYKTNKDWYTFSEPLAEEGNRGQKVIELAGFVFKTYPGVEKIVTEAREDTRQQIIDSLPSNLKTTDDSEDDYILTWPVMNMDKFDPTLPGSHFKSLRNAKSKFYRDHKVEIKNISDVDKQDLIGVVDCWVPIAKKREGDFVHEEPFYNIIESGFRGLSAARVMIVDGQVVGFNAGWKMPNSEIFYAAVGIHDYSIQDLGLMLYLEDLEWIKATGYKVADMGGVEEGNPLNFKNQFLPESWYKTYVFSIIKK